MKHLDLFSGIGGFALAVDAVWPGSKHTFCEVDPYCQALLKQRFTGSTVHGDIRNLTAYNGRIDILTGGFPCQPFSQAGKRRGTDDNRFLWPEMLRVIREFRPRWVIAENVRGIVTIEQGMVFEQVCFSLENAGYEVQPFVIPAIAKNAPHRRDRVWILAKHTASVRCNIGVGNRQGGQVLSPKIGQAKKDKQERNRRVDRIVEGDSNAADTSKPRLEGGQEKGQGLFGQQDRNGRYQGGDWSQDWLEVATKLCGMDDGVSAELDGLKYSKSAHRVARLKALGNSVVVPVVVEIMRGIQAAEEGS